MPDRKPTLMVWNEDGTFLVVADRIATIIPAANSPFVEITYTAADGSFANATTYTESIKSVFIITKLPPKK